MADGASSPALTIKSLSARGVVVPMRRPLVTGGGSVTQAPLVLIDLQTTEGPLGHAYAFTYTPLALAGTVSLINEIGTALAGYSAMPFALSQKLTGMFKLLGHEGLVGVALAGIDTAAWDAFAKSKDMPLYQTLGADHTALPLYNSCGLGLIGPNKVGDEAKALLEGGFTAVKLRLGYHTLAEDLAVVDAVRNAVPPEIHVMTDYNQSLTIAEAKIRVQAMADRDLTWIEEPTRYADYDGHAEISAVSTIPIQLGENCWGPHDFARAIDAGSGDYLMPDLIKIGGVTGWMKASALAERAGIPVSCHLFPEVSAHLLAATPTAHWLEYVDWAEPVLAEPLERKDGKALPSQSPGVGLAWNEEAVSRYAL